MKSIKRITKKEYKKFISSMHIYNYTSKLKILILERDIGIA